MVNGKMMRHIPVSFQPRIEPGRLLRAVRREMPGVEQVDAEILSERPGEIASITLLREITKIKDGVTSLNLVIANGQDHGDGETTRGYHTLLPRIEPRIPARIISEPVVGVSDVASDHCELWFLPGSLFQQQG